LIFRRPVVDYTKIDTGEIGFAEWNVSIKSGKGLVSDMQGDPVAHFNIEKDGSIVLLEGEYKFADLALIALRSFLRYGAVTA